MEFLSPIWRVRSDGRLTFDELTLTVNGTFPSFLNTTALGVYRPILKSCELAKKTYNEFPLIEVGNAVPLRNHKENLSVDAGLSVGAIVEVGVGVGLVG